MDIAKQTNPKFPEIKAEFWKTHSSYHINSLAGLWCRAGVFSYAEYYEILLSLIKVLTLSRHT